MSRFAYWLWKPEPCQTGSSLFSLACRMPGQTGIASAATGSHRSRTQAPCSGTQRQVNMNSSSQTLSLARVMTSSRLSAKSGPTGMIRRPPTASCSFSGCGTCEKNAPILLLFF